MIQLLFHSFLQAAVEPQKFLFRDNKINTVIVVMSVVFLGIAAYMVFMGRRVKKLEAQAAELKARQDAATGTKS